MLFMR